MPNIAEKADAGVVEVFVAVAQRRSGDRAGTAAEARVSVLRREYRTGTAAEAGVSA
jgi:hypothetical protein